MLNSIILKKALILTLLAPFALIGCSSSSHDNREIEGSDNYLNAPPLKTLVLPKQNNLPAVSDDFRVFRSKSTGNVGKDLDIRPPLLPSSLIDNAYVSYKNGEVKFNALVKDGFWKSIPKTLLDNNIPFISSGNAAIRTAKVTVIRDPNVDEVEASYNLTRRVNSNREYVTVKLASLRRAGKTITDPIQIQYYTVSLFNDLMLGLKPIADIEPVVLPYKRYR